MALLLSHRVEVFAVADGTDGWRCGVADRGGRGGGLVADLVSPIAAVALVVVVAELVAFAVVAVVASVRV